MKLSRSILGNACLLLTYAAVVALTALSLCSGPRDHTPSPDGSASEVGESQ